MKLTDFINEKENELKQQHKEVMFYEAIEVELGKNSVSENYMSTNTDFEQEVMEVKLSEIDEYRSTGWNPNGTKVVFKVKLPRKRRFTNKEYYLKFIE